MIEKETFSGQSQQIDSTNMPQVIDQPTERLTALYSRSSPFTKLEVKQKQGRDPAGNGEGFFRAITQNSLDPVFVVDREGLITYANHAVTRSLGYTREELIGKSGCDLIATADMPRARTDFSKAIVSTQEQLPNAFRVKHKDGSERYFEGIGTNLLSNPVVNGLVINVRDVTAQAKAEEALRASEQMCKDLAEKSPAGIYIIQDATFRYVNAKFADIHGYTVEEIIDKLPVEDLVHPDDLPLVQEQLREGLTGKTDSLSYEFRTLRKTGEIIHLEVYGSATLHEGRPAVIGTALDITEWKQAVEEVRCLRVAIEQAAEGIMITDPEGSIQYVNPAFERITGYTRGEAFGKTPRILKSGVQGPAFYEELWKTIKGGNIWNGPITNRRNDGKLIQQYAVISPLLNAQGELTGYVSLQRDITESVRLEEQLRQAQKLEAIGTLAGGIAHDFNNILSAIMGYTDMAIRIVTEENRLLYYLKQSYKASERARDLVRQILSLSRQQEGKPCPLSVGPIIKEGLKLLRSSLPATIQISHDLRSEKDVVLADPTHIHQILMNLCLNAAQAMGERAGMISVSLAPVDIPPGDALTAHDLEPGMHLKLTVSDTGVGMDALTMRQIFDPYYTTKRPGEGTSLGLSLVREIAKNYGGTITVKSTVGVGSEFNVYLPQLMETEERQETGAGESIPRGKERILFVDDEEMIVEIGEIMLTCLGYEVVGTTSSLEALTLFRAQPEQFDLVITDLTMPNMTGVELTRELLHIRPSISIIGCTGFSDMISPEKAISIGMKDFIKKPVVQSRLAEAIRRALDKKE
jgi:PAS domain S-box-containing protein